jgi:MFS family permease
MRDFSTRVYRLLLRLYPVEFRREYGDQMVLAFRDRLRDSGRRSLLATFAFWASALVDLLSSAWAEQREANPAQQTGVFGVALSTLAGLTLLIDSRTSDVDYLAYLLLVSLPMAASLRFPAWSLAIVSIFLALPLAIFAYFAGSVVILGGVLLVLVRNPRFMVFRATLPSSMQHIIISMGVIGLTGGVGAALLDTEFWRLPEHWWRMMQWSGMALLLVIVCAPLARYYGTRAALVPLLMMSVFYSGIADPAYFLGVINPAAGEAVWIVSMLPPIVFPPLLLLPHGKVRGAIGVLILWSLMLIFCTMTPTLVRADTAWAWDAPFVVVRAVEAGHLLLSGALALIWYDHLESKSVTGWHKSKTIA